MQRNYKIDTIKGICVLFILVTHFNWNDNQRDLLLFPFWIEMAVPIFMIITGYVYSMSFDKNGCYKFENVINIKYICKRTLRYLIPYFMVFGIELLIYYTFIDKISIFSSIMLLVTGGFGPGAYYIPILIQIIFLIPLIYILIRKNPLFGVTTCFVFNLLYEMEKTLLRMSDSIYRLCSLRYIFVLSFGAFLYFYKRKVKKISMMIIGGVGGGFLAYTKYIGNAPAFLRNWTGTCCVSCLFICPFVYWVLNSGKKIEENIICYVGKASYNIYLFQMIYYWAFFNTINSTIQSRILQFIISIISCLIAGVLFYKIENSFTKRLMKRLF